MHYSHPEQEQGPRVKKTLRRTIDPGRTVKPVTAKTGVEENNVQPPGRLLSGGEEDMNREMPFYTVARGAAELETTAEVRCDELDNAKVVLKNSHRKDDDRACRQVLSRSDGPPTRGGGGSRDWASGSR